MYNTVNGQIGTPTANILPVMTVEQFNKLMGVGSYTFQENDPLIPVEVSEPAFGTHIREAINVIKDWRKSGK